MAIDPKKAGATAIAIAAALAALGYMFTGGEPPGECPECVPCDCAEEATAEPTESESESEAVPAEATPAAPAL